MAKALVTEALSRPLRPPTCCIAVGLLLRADISAATCIKSKLSPRVRRDRENMREIAVQLALRDPAYVDMCVKFVSHFLWIASSMLRTGDGSGMWDEEDGFFYDVLRLPDGHSERLKVRRLWDNVKRAAAH